MKSKKISSVTWSKKGQSGVCRGSSSALEVGKTSVTRPNLETSVENFGAEKTRHIKYFPEINTSDFHKVGCGGEARDVNLRQNRA